MLRMGNAKERQQGRADIDQQSRRIREQLLRGPDKWVHHVADLSADRPVQSFEHHRPVAMSDRLERLSGVAHLDASDVLLTLPERTLTPRVPYQASPVSYLNAIGRSWELWGEDGSLQWAEAADPRYGGIEFWFLDVTPGSTRVVTIYVTAGTTGRGVTGNLDLKSSAAAPRSFPFTGLADQTLDVVVRPADLSLVLVTLEAGDGVDFLVFREATYGALGS